ncbi:uncharacterized protein [Dermacentor albipictus]|uniref:uncharacterized protein isoform X2 n=1 Tax=Dermacentor albipictus TaxID=60249 RepID=UPI0038FD22D2
MSAKKDDDANQTGQKAAGPSNAPAASPTRHNRRKSRRSDVASPDENPRTGKKRASLHGFKKQKRDGALSTGSSLLQERRRRKSSGRNRSKAACVAGQNPHREEAPVEELSEAALALHDEDADVIADRDEKRADSSAKFIPNVSDNGHTQVRYAVADITASFSPISSDLRVIRASTTGVRSPEPLLVATSIFSADGQAKDIFPATSPIMSPLIQADSLEKAVSEEISSRRQRIHRSRQVSNAYRSNPAESKYDAGHSGKNPVSVQRGISRKRFDVPSHLGAKRMQSAATSPRKSFHRVEPNEDANMAGLSITASVGRIMAKGVTLNEQERPPGTNQKETLLPKPPGSQVARDVNKYSFVHSGVQPEETEAKERDLTDQITEGHQFHRLNVLRETYRAHSSPPVIDEQHSFGREAHHEVTERPFMDLSPILNQELAPDQSACPRVAVTALTEHMARAKENDHPQKLDGCSQSKQRISEYKVRDPAMERDRLSAAGKKGDLPSPLPTRTRTRCHGKRRADPGALLNHDGRSRGNIDEIVEQISLVKPVFQDRYRRGSYIISADMEQFIANHVIATGSVAEAQADKLAPDVYTFLAIPFAGSVASKARFLQPKPVTSRRELVAKRADACLQSRPAPDGVISTGNTTEDCLQLNVWTPVDPSQRSGVLRTVLVVLHGADFKWTQDYDGSGLSALGDLVVVVPYYRLHLLGFLSNGTDAAPGNLALHDQIQALRWTEHNAEKFGGNATSVVLVGHGAGAVSIGLHLVSPVWERSLVNVSRIVLMSGSPLQPFANNSELASVASSLGCNLSVDVSQERQWACLLGQPAGAFVTAEAYTNLVAGPSFDSDCLPQRWPQRSDRLHLKQVLIGNSAHDGVTEEMYGDVLFKCPVLYFSEYLSSLSHTVFSYYLDYDSRASNEPDQTPHDDLAMLFGEPLSGVSTNAGRNLSRKLIDIISGFAKNGQLPHASDAAWPQFSSPDTQNCNVVIGHMENKLVTDTRTGKCSLLRRFILPADFHREADGG